MVWGKVGDMKNNGTGNNFVLGFDNPSIGDTKVVLTTFGTTWTLDQTTVLDANFGMSRQDQTVLPPTSGRTTAWSSGFPAPTTPTTSARAALPTFDERLHYRHHAELDAAVAQGDQLLGTVGLTKVFTTPRDPARASTSSASS